MSPGNWLKSLLKKSPKEEAFDTGAINFRVTIVEFSGGVDDTFEKDLISILSSQKGLRIHHFTEPFSKTFLDLDSRTLFDLMDKGQDILDKTDADVLIWGCREGNKIRLNFQTQKLLETDEIVFISLLDSLYIPANGLIPESIKTLIYGAVVSAIKTFTAEEKVHKKYLLKSIINKLIADNSAKSLSLEYAPYIMNFLGLIYLSHSFSANDEKDFKITQNLFDTALKHQDLIINPIHLGCIYHHLGQLYDSAADYMEKKPLSYFKGAITNYRQAQKYLTKYNYPYDYGYICYRLSKLFFRYFMKKEDLSALRDAIFQLREAEKIYTPSLFPEFWAHIEGELGRMLSLLGNLTKSDDISNLAISSYKNQQKVITEKKDPLEWAEIQEKLGDISYRLGKKTGDRGLLEEALEYFHDALYIFENMEKQDESKNITIAIAKTSKLLNMI